ncbi:NAD-dependent epimerase/dehydratase family protein [bacterium]|nr:NAD-dependent epimerase/dehydratase family protein [bacterium]
MSQIEALLSEQQSIGGTWLVTGGAGFIGSNLLEFLLRHGQSVRVLDNLATGHQRNLDDVRQLVGETAWTRCQFIHGDLTDITACQEAVRDVHFILHQGALGSVPRSLKDPLASHAANVTGTLNLLQTAREAGVQRVVYASSSSVYGDHPDLPKLEGRTGRCLSPYAATKMIDEIYAGVFARCYELPTVGLRYFNVFGPRQDPAGAYAAVIPKWIAALLEDEPVFINGDGETSRDFCHVRNVVQANILAACRPLGENRSRVYNVAVGERTTLNELFALIKANLATVVTDRSFSDVKAHYREPRTGDVRHSLANISAAQNDLGYAPTHDIRRGMEETIGWYVADYRRRRATPRGRAPLLAPA